MDKDHRVAVGSPWIIHDKGGDPNKNPDCVVRLIMPTNEGERDVLPVFLSDAGAKSFLGSQGMSGYVAGQLGNADDAERLLLALEKLGTRHVVIEPDPGRDRKNIDIQEFLAGMRRLK